MKFQQLNSPEYKVILQVVCNEHKLDRWIANIIEEYIYGKVEFDGKIFCANTLSLEEGKMIYDVRFDQRHGKYREWYMNGQIKFEYSNKNGQKHGIYREWHENGQLKIQTTYKNGEIIGKYKRWYANGVQWLEWTDTSHKN